MRIIAGKFRSQSLLAPKGRDTRPTSDRLRETLFNVLAPRIEGAAFADLFAGTGAVGIEALSRGARQVYFAENAGHSLDTLRTNLKKLGIGPEATVEAAGTLALLRRLVRHGIRLDIVFLDPPYKDEEAYRAILQFLAEQPCLAPQAIVVAEHARRLPLAAFGDLQPFRTIPQGEASLTFFHCNAEGQTVSPAGA
ncbi:MAG: 16S rRNA (guanine(966)-N(2))-methyltransferase RsmD [Acidobacteriaceae bacterium]